MFCTVWERHVLYSVGTELCTWWWTGCAALSGEGVVGTTTTTIRCSNKQTLAMFVQRVGAGDMDMPGVKRVADLASCPVPTDHATTRPNMPSTYSRSSQWTTTSTTSTSEAAASSEEVFSSLDGGASPGTNTNVSRRTSLRTSGGASAYDDELFTSMFSSSLVRHSWRASKSSIPDSLSSGVGLIATSQALEKRALLEQQVRRGRRSKGRASGVGGVRTSTPALFDGQLRQQSSRRSEQTGRSGPPRGRSSGRATSGRRHINSSTTSSRRRRTLPNLFHSDLAPIQSMNLRAGPGEAPWSSEGGDAASSSAALEGNTTRPQHNLLEDLCMSSSLKRSLEASLWRDVLDHPRAHSERRKSRELQERMKEEQGGSSVGSVVDESASAPARGTARPGDGVAEDEVENLKPHMGKSFAASVSQPSVLVWDTEAAKDPAKSPSKFGLLKVGSFLPTSLSSVPSLSSSFTNWNFLSVSPSIVSRSDSEATLANTFQNSRRKFWTAASPRSERVGGGASRGPPSSGGTTSSVKNPQNKMGVAANTPILSRGLTGFASRRTSLVSRLDGLLRSPSSFEENPLDVLFQTLRVVLTA